MRNVKKIVALFICFVIILPIVTACGKPAGDKDGQHVTIKETGYSLVADGISEYRIVLPDEPRGYEAHAAQELALNFYKATHYQPEILFESDIAFSENAKLLFIGETLCAANAGVSADKSEFGARGFVLKRAASNVFFVGGDTTGTLYAVYEFLHYQFGYEPYAYDEVSLQEGVTDKKLLDFNMREIPDIAHTQGVGRYFDSKYILDGHRMRYNVFNEVFVNATGQPWHNTFDYVPPSVYNDSSKTESYHPKWFTPNGAQLHYTAHGDAAELMALQDLVFDRMKFFIERDFASGKFYEYIGFMHEDYEVWGQSDDPYSEQGRPDSVGLLKEKYGSKAFAAAMLIQFINPIADRLKDYMDTEWDGRNMNITIFAYLDTQTAPTKVVNGKDVPIDDSVKLRPNVNVMIAPIRANYTVDYPDTGMAGTITEWSAITDQFSFWFYDYYFLNTMIYFDSTYSLQSFYRAARDMNAKYVFNEFPMAYHCAPFGDLKIYLTSKLTWDADSNVDVLVDNFFDNYYKDASGTMRQFFEEMRTYFAYLRNTLNFPGVGSSNPDLPSFWQEGVITGFLKKVDKAYSDILPLQAADLATYTLLKNRILRESIMPRYIALRHLAKEIYDERTFAQEVIAFKADCASLGIINYGIAEGQYVESLVFTR